MVDESGRPVTPICGDARRLADSYVGAAPLAEAAAAAIDAHAVALAAVEVGSLCHGDLKAVRTSLLRRAGSPA